MEAAAAMDEQQQRDLGEGGGGGGAEPPAPPPPPPAPESHEEEEGGGEEEEEEEVEEEEEEPRSEDDELMEKATRLMDKITSSPENPNPAVLHALASLLEEQEKRYMEQCGHASSSSRASHNIGRLGNLVREHDDFFELISSKYLSDASYSVSVQAAAGRLLLSCSLTWLYPHDFEDDVLAKIKDWVIAETPSVPIEYQNWVSDYEMLKTYATGILAVCLAGAGGGQVVEDVLTSGLSAKLMRYLRVRVLGETSITLKDSSHLIETKSTSGAISVRARDESRGRVRQVLETPHFDDSRITSERCLDEQIVEGDQDRIVSRQAFGKERWVDGGEPPDGLEEGKHICDVDASDSHEGKVKVGDFDENGRDDSSRRRPYRGWTRSRGKGRTNEANLENESHLTSPGSGNWLGQGRSHRDRGAEVRKIPDSRRPLGRNTADVIPLEREDNDECFQDCTIGSKDITDLVKKAVRAAEAEARTANAPAEAIRAAGDAAAEVVKSAALEQFKSSNNEEAAVLAASRAASTVIDAANSIEAFRRDEVSSVCAEPINSSSQAPESNADVEEYFIPSVESLAQLREKYCIQCLETLGDYVEVLGPVLHEKGVDVCLALLQQNSSHTSKVATLLPDVMKLICALAAHRKFAALFVDRGGMQKLLAVPRVAHTFFGLSSCLFTIGSLQVIMERVCALPSDLVDQVVELALELLVCPQDQARKNAALFFCAAFVFRAVLDAFDAQGGLQKVLGRLNDAASVRSGINSGPLGLSTSGSLRSDRSPTEVLTSSEKQIAYHTCVALRQYFRAHFILLVDSIRPNKRQSSVRAAYKPLDISNEAIDAVFLQLQKDRKLGPAFVRARFPAVESFLGLNGHITMLELCQAPPVERYLHDLLQYALGVLHIVTLVPSSRKMIVNSTLSNNRVGIAVILDAASVSGNYVDPEIIQPALNVLVNLVCPAPSISNKPPLQSSQSQAPLSNGPSIERSVSDRAGESAVVDRGSTATPCTQSNSNSGLVGIRLGAGYAGLAAQLEQGYRQAREAVRTNSGIRVLLHLLQPRIYSPAAALDCLRALACRVLLGLARDDAIAHILTKLQVGKKLSELIRDSGSQTHGAEQGRWQSELSQAAIELISIVTNAGRASTLAATDAAMPTLRRIERAAIAAATPITYHSRELLLLIHEHLQASGLATAAAALLKDAQLTPLPSLAAPSSLVHQATQEASSVQLQWPSGLTPGGFLTDNSKNTAKEEDTSSKFDSVVSHSKKKPLVFSPSFGLQSRNQSLSHDSHLTSATKAYSVSKQLPAPENALEAPSESLPKPNIDAEYQLKTPIVLPMKRKLSEVKDPGCLPSSGKRIHTGDQGLRSPVFPTSSTVRKSGLLSDPTGFSTPTFNMRHQHCRSAQACLPSDYPDDNQYSSSSTGLAAPSFQLGVQHDPQPNNSERLTLDSLVVQYLKHQHRQCPAPITTLPPLSLLQPHVCPEPRRTLDAPSNVTARLGTREFRSMYGGVHGNRRDRQFVYSRFRPWRTCRDNTGTPLTCISFLSDTARIAVGSHGGELKIFDSNSSNLLDSFASHQSPVTLVQTCLSGETELVLSSSAEDVRLWDASAVGAGPMHSYEGCKAARFSKSGDVFAALSSEMAQREILLYDIQTNQLQSKLSDTSSSSTGRGHSYAHIHFNPTDTMLLWNGVLWDMRVSSPVHWFDQFTDYGGGGFHPAGNEVIINSEVWDLRNYRLLRSVPSLDQTTITFNARGDVIYAILRRNLDDVMSAVHTRRVKHPLFAAFRTVDAVNYSDIATIPVDRCVLDFATEPTDSFLGLITMDDQDEMLASARVYEIGRRKPTDDDSDPDDAESEEEDDDEDDDDNEVMDILGPDIDGDDESDMSNEDSVNDLDGDYMLDGEFGGGGGMMEVFADEIDEDDDSDDMDDYSSDDEDY